MLRTFLVCVVFVCLFPLAMLSGCTSSRLGQLEKKAGRVEKQLLSERSRVLGMESASMERSARMDHLSQLRMTLSAANVGRGTIPLLVEEAQRPVAYDVIDEVYSTIEWNIPLLPTDPARKQMPASFAGNMLRLNAK
jgi:hypothetical protein